MDDLDELVTWTLVRAGHHAERMLTALFAEHGLTPIQFGVLAYLATGRTFTQSELARAVLVRPQSMGEVITILIDRGLLERAGPGGRGRRTSIRLTDDGATLLMRVWPTTQRANDPDRLGLTPEEGLALNDLLHRMLRTDLTAPGSVS